MPVARPFPSSNHTDPPPPPLDTREESHVEEHLDPSAAWPFEAMDPSLAAAVADCPSLAYKLSCVMGDIGRVAKNGRNTFHNYAYATEADIVDAVRGLLAKHRVMLFPEITDLRVLGQLHWLDIEFEFEDGDTREKRRLKWKGCGADTSDKGLYKALTGAEKYFLMKTFLISTGDDPEASDAEGNRTDAAAPRRHGRPERERPAERQDRADAERRRPRRRDEPATPAAPGEPAPPAAPPVPPPAPTDDPQPIRRVWIVDRPRGIYGVVWGTHPQPFVTTDRALAKRLDEVRLEQRPVVLLTEPSDIGVRILDVRTPPPAAAPGGVH